MYYKLKEQYCLRGWDLLPYAVVDREAHTARFVERETFEALTFCDASVDLDLPLVPQSIRDKVAKLAEQGIVEAYGATEIQALSQPFYGASSLVDHRALQLPVPALLSLRAGRALRRTEP